MNCDVAMEMCLAGTPITAAEAEKFGLVSKVVPAEQLMETALKMATTIASYSRVRHWFLLCLIVRPPLSSSSSLPLFLLMAAGRDFDERGCELGV